MQALGSIEVVGLVAGVEAADVACKTADVQLVGYELAKGGGYVAVKVVGQVAAVQAAIAAAEAAASRLGRVVSTLVIPRPSEQLESLIFSPTTVGRQAPEEAEPPAPEPATPSTRKPAAPKAPEPLPPAAPKRSTRAAAEPPASDDEPES